MINLLSGARVQGQESFLSENELGMESRKLSTSWPGSKEKGQDPGTTLLTRELKGGAGSGPQGTTWDADERSPIRDGAGRQAGPRQAPARRTWQPLSPI